MVFEENLNMLYTYVWHEDIHNCPCIVCIVTAGSATAGVPLFTFLSVAHIKQGELHEAELHGRKLFVIFKLHYHIFYFCTSMQ